MIDYSTNKKVCNAVLWLFAGIVIVIALTSCSPYQDAPAGPTRAPTLAPSVTATAVNVSHGTQTPTPRPITCTVTAYTLNFRAGPGTRYAVKEILERGERVTVIEGGDWLKVETAQRATGWVYGRWCKA